MRAHLRKLAEERSLRDGFSGQRSRAHEDLTEQQGQLAADEDRVADLQHLLATRDSRIADLLNRLAARDTRIAGLQAQLAARDAEAPVLQAQLAQRDQYIQALLTSTSWEIAAPLRYIGRSLRAGLQRLPLQPGTGLWKTLRFGFRLLPLPTRTKQRLLHLALRKGFLNPPLLAPAPGPMQQTESPISVRIQEAWPAAQPLVSVVIPCYNHGGFVPEAVDSILAQTFENLEVIVVDSGSTRQDSLQALHQLRRPRTRVYYRRERHLVGDNRNFGIERARGKYICCLDADDMIKPTYLEKAVFLLEAKGYDLVSTSIESFGNESRVYSVERFPILADMVRANHIPNCAVFRRDLWERAGGFRDTGLGAEYVHEDWRFWLRLVALGAKVANIVDEPLFLYRVHSPSSLSKQDGTVPSIDKHREAIVALNGDVLTEEAFRFSEQRRLQRIQVLDPLVNLRPYPSPDASSTTILIVLPYLIMGGAERLISEVARYLRSRDYRIVVVTTLPVDPKYGDTTEWFERATAEIYHLPRFLDAACWREFIFYLIDAKRVSLLWLAGSAFFYDLLPDLKAEWPHLKVIDLLFNTVGHTADNRKHSGLIDLNLVESREVYDCLRRAGVAPGRIVLVPSGVDLERYRPTPKPSRLLEALGIDPSSFVVGFSGRLSEEKCPEIFLEIADCCRDESRLVFLMTGAGPLADQVRRWVESAGMGNRLQFLGKVDEVREYLALYDVLVLPSRLDGRPIVALESLATGVPIVASRVGGLPELVHDGETGFLCDTGDVAGFAERVRWLAAHPEEHRRMRVAARSFAESELDALQLRRLYEAAIRGALALPRRSTETVPVPWSFPPGKGHPVVLMLPFFTVGGAERVLSTLLAGWKAEGRTVVVFLTHRLLPSMADRSGDLRELTPFCYRLDEILPRERWLDIVVETLLSLPRPTLFSIASLWVYEVAEELRARVPRLRMVDQLFNGVCHLDLNRRIAGSLDLTIASYAGLAHMILADGRPCEQVETIYAGIDPPRIPCAAELARLRKQVGVPPTGKLICFVGRLSEEKRPEWIVRLCREIQDPEVRILVVGDGPLSQLVEEGVRSEERLRWIPWVHAVEAVLAAADVVVLPSCFEGIPLVLIEALALGRPVVATRVGGIPELAGTPGLELVDGADFTGFRDTVLRVLERPPRDIGLPPTLFAGEMARRYDGLLFGVPD
jgi:glycosyltransferase involved in cell wall biosynthesis